MTTTLSNKGVSVFGNMRVLYGHYVTTDTTVTITTGMVKIIFASLVSGANATSPIVAISSGTITGTVASTDAGEYIVIGW